MSGTTLKVGALAKRTGITVRTLHHYDDIGLLSPSGRTPSGHRLYDENDVARLQQIASLRRLGLSLDEIAACLARPAFTLERTLELHAERITADIEEQKKMRSLVLHLRDRVRENGHADLDELTRTIRTTLTYERYYSADQLETLERRASEVGTERMREVEHAWERLFASFREAMDRNVDAESEEVRALAEQAAALVAEFTGGDAGIQASLTTMMREEGPDVLGAHGVEMDAALWAYMGRARAALERG